MKHVLLVLDSDFAYDFLIKVISDYHSYNAYNVIYKNDNFLPEDFFEQQIPSSFTFNKCDYTSTFRLEKIIRSNTSDAFIIIDDDEERLFVYGYLRTRFRNLRITTNIKNKEICKNLKKDSSLILIDEFEVLSNRFTIGLPNIPVVPHDFGLEQGEIMEVNIPSGSIFAHRQIGTINQTDWKIVGLYRLNQFILTNRNLVIWPGDSLLIAGKPNVLKNIYNQIMSSTGQFPAPFGQDIYLYIDMIDLSEEKILFDFSESLFLHRNLKSTNLVIRIINPTNFKIINKIENFIKFFSKNNDILLKIDYNNFSFQEVLKQDQGKGIGLIIVNQKIFDKKIKRLALFKTRIPIFKTALHSIQNMKFFRKNKDAKSIIRTNTSSFKEVKESIIIFTNKINNSNVSIVIFDISKQLNLAIKVYDYEPDGDFNTEIETEFDNLAKVFDCKVSFEQNNMNNPVLYLNNLNKPVLHFLPFSEDMINPRFLSFFKTSFESFSFMIKNNPQFFIPD